MFTAEAQRSGGFSRVSLRERRRLKDARRPTEAARAVGILRVPGGARMGGNTPDEQCSEGADEGLFFLLKIDNQKSPEESPRWGGKPCA
ncbi:hypothetical protein [Microscilla marina]|uniref:hypothetical protein n=1 Tax=Microscilla marina TaxID=1027 RepID=UPI0002DA48E7|nr:hypothetical protein [Microscilla marina]